MVFVDVKHHERRRNGSVLRGCVKVEVTVLGSPPLISLMVSSDVGVCVIKRREVSWTLTKKLSQLAEESKEVELG